VRWVRRGEKRARNSPTEAEGRTVNCGDELGVLEEVGHGVASVPKGCNGCLWRKRCVLIGLIYLNVVG
jgi:hypothetical protein